MARRKNEPRVLWVDEFTANDWVQIKHSAIKVLNSGQCGKDELRAAIIGFVNWVMSQNIRLEIEMRSNEDTLQ